VGAIAMTEPGTGSDLQAVRTTARHHGNEYRLNGQKTFITNGQLADLIIVVAKTGPGEGAKGISLVVLETAGAEGFRRAVTSTRSGCTPPTPRNCSLTMSRCRPRTCSEPRKATGSTS